MAKKKHEYSHTSIKHHHDGSHTMTHHHESGDMKKDMEYAVPDHDAMMDGMQQNIGAEGAPEPGAEGGAPVPGAAA